MPRVTKLFLAVLMLMSSTKYVTSQWRQQYNPFGNQGDPNHYSSANYVAQQSVPQFGTSIKYLGMPSESLFHNAKPLGLPKRRYLVHGYLDDSSGLNEYRRYHGENSLLGIPGSNNMLGSYLRRNWPFNDVISFVAALRLQHEARFGKNNQMAAVTPYPMQ